MSHDNDTFHLDELNLQRLVDNELSVEQIRQALAEAELSDDALNWKKIALAFAENQMFERSFLQNDSGQAVGAVTTLVNEETTVTRPPEHVEIKETIKQKSWWPAALAVSLLLLMTAVYQVSRDASETASKQVAPSVSSGNPSSNVARTDSIKSFDRVTLASYEPDHQLAAQDVESPAIAKHNSSIPLYDVDRLNPQQLASLRGDDRSAREAMFAQVLPKSFSPEVVQQLQQSGGMVDQSLEFISGRLEDGRSYVIPYRTIRFLPGQ
jgi:hypothetical protein